MISLHEPRSHFTDDRRHWVVGSCFMGRGYTPDCHSSHDSRDVHTRERQRACGHITGSCSVRLVLHWILWILHHPFAVYVSRSWEAASCASPRARIQLQHFAPDSLIRRRQRGRTEWYSRHRTGCSHSIHTQAQSTVDVFRVPSAFLTALHITHHAQRATTSRYSFRVILTVKTS